MKNNPSFLTKQSKSNLNRKCN